MKKWNSKNKRRVLISLLFTLIGVGFLGMRSVEPLNAADNEETKQKASKADDSYPLENNENYTLYPDFTNLTMEEGDDYEFPLGWAMGIHNTTPYNFVSLKEPFTSKYQLFKGETPKIDAADTNPSKVFWQLDPSGGAVFAARGGTAFNTRTYSFILAQEFTLKREGGTKIFYYMNGSQATLPGSGVIGQPPTKLTITLNPFGLKNEGTYSSISRYNLRNTASVGVDEFGKQVYLSIGAGYSLVDGGLSLDGVDKFGSVTLEAEDFDKLEKYADNKMRMRVTVSNSRNAINAVKLNYAQVIQAALFVENPLQIEIPVGSDVAYLQDKTYFKSLIPKEEIMVFTEDTGETGKPLTEYGEDADFTVDEVQINNNYTDTVTQEGGRTSYARISTTIEGKKLQGIVPFNLNVVWGNTIALGTADFEQESAVAFSLVKTGEQYEVVQNFGNGWNAKNFPLNKTKVTVDYFKQPTDGKTLVIDEETTSDSTVTLTGTDIPVEKGDIWGVNGRQKVSIGDVIRVQSNEPTKEWLYKNSENILTAGDFSYQPQIVYYSVTAEGLQALPLNQVEAKKNIPVDWKTPASVVTNRFNSNPKDFLTFDSNPSLDFEKVTFTGEFTDPPNTDTANKTNVTSTLEVTAQMADSDIAVKYPLKPTFDVSGTEFENWLPYYSKWLNSETEIIPKKNAFVMRYSEGYQNESGETIGKTEIVGHSEEIDIEQEGDKAGTVVLPFKTSVNEQFLVFSNVGYYQGNQIAVKMSLKPSNLATGTSAPRYNYVGISSSRLFEVQVDSSVKTVEVTFDFLKQTEGENWESWSEIALSGYWTLSNFKNTKDVIVPADLIDHIYSIDRSYKTDKDELAPIFLKYQEESTDSLVISSVGQNSNQPNATNVCLVSEQELATITYTNSKQFQCTLVPNRVIGASGNPYLPSIAYVSSTYAKVAIPDPRGLTQVFDTITADNYENNEGDIVSPLNYQFIQSIPYESEKNRDQQMEWLLPNDINGSITESIEWKIINESGVDGTKYFTIDGSKIKPTSEAYEDENFYNHYYFFQKNMMINTEEEIDQTILQSKDNEGKYLDYTGNIGLQVTDEGRNIPLVEEPFHSYINFAAEADFEPVYRDSEDGNKVKPVPGSSTQTEKNLLITHKYTEVTPPPIDGYEYADESIPENYTELPVRYTQAEDNKVQLVYAESIGELFFDIPEEMNFQKVSIPTVFQKTEYLQAIDPDWAIKVTDERSEKQRTPWKLSAQIADQSFYTHTDSEYQGQKVDSVYEENIPLMSNILRFANADGATNDLTQSVVIYDSGDEPQAYNNYPIQWTEKNTGFFLDLQAYHYYPLGKYKATIDFTVEYVE